jgi:hypothetical protein
VSNYCNEQKSLNSDGQQFHQYQQNNHFSPQIIEHKKYHDICTLVLYSVLYIRTVVSMKH